MAHQGGTSEEQPVHRRMVELRLACDRQIRVGRQQADLAAGSFRRSLLPIHSTAEKAVACREKLGKLKDYLRELEDDLSVTLAVKSGKEARHVATSESLSTAKTRTEGLKKIIQGLRAKRDDYALIISQQLHALEAPYEKSCEDTVDEEDLEEAISWYNKVLGFRTEGGEGVKFIFNKIDLDNPKKEYSFSIRLECDTYTLLHCDIHLQDIEELLEELNRTNGLFKFARLMRQKFQAAILNGALPATTLHPDLSTISISSPPPLSTDSISEPSSMQVQTRSRKAKKVTPQSQTTLRRTPRLKVKVMDKEAISITYQEKDKG